MVIEYEKDKFLKENHQIEIEDTKNIFLQGRNPYDGRNTYFGIWENKNYLVIATLISGRTISYEYSLDKNIYTECYIKEYLKSNNNVDVISKDIFKEELKRIKAILEI